MTVEARKDPKIYDMEVVIEVSTPHQLRGDKSFLEVWPALHLQGAENIDFLTIGLVLHLSTLLRQLLTNVEH